MTSDDHAAPLQKVFLKARVTFNHGASSFDCIVRELSATGARLALSETMALPEAFDLHIPQKARTYRATLRWRREDGAGVAFPDELTRTAPRPVGSVPADDEASRMFLLRRLSELEAENLALRRALAGAAHHDAEGAA